MARRTLIWHLGLPQAARPVVPASLAAHAEALDRQGILVAATTAEAEAATCELLRTGTSPGRRDVAGTWARVCARVWDHKGVSVLSTPDLAAAGQDEVRLALDPLRGVEVHLVLGVEPLAAQLLGAWLGQLRAGATTGWEKYAERVLAEPGGAGPHRQAEDFRAGHDLPAVLARWGWTLHAERLHVVAGRDPGATWARVVELTGLPPAELPATLPAPADPAGAAVLRRVNRVHAADPGSDAGSPALGSTTQLLERTAEVEAGALVPVLPTAAAEGARRLVERWASDLGAPGAPAYDVRGAVGDLLDPVDPDARPPAAPSRRDQLAVAVDRLAETLAENTRLREQLAVVEADRDRLDRTRRKLKRRLRALD
ncbi:hypothetical protein GCM10027596_00860 [Nocardioides korecus]